MTNRQTEIVTNKAPELVAASEEVLRKLIVAAGEDEAAAGLVALATEAFPDKYNDTIALQILFSILLHDNLSALLNGQLKDHLREHQHLTTEQMNAIKRHFLRS